MVAIPDNIRPYVDAVVRYHFWMLVPLVPLIVLPLVFLTNGRLSAQIDSARSQIESRLTAVRGVAGIQPHPNASWATDIDAGTAAVKRQTFDEWRRFWESQQPMRVWPASLGADFVQRAAVLKPDVKLPRKLLERYQNGVRAIVRELPGRMGADEMMVDAEGSLPGSPEPQPGRGDAGAKPRGAGRLVVWNAGDQKRLYESFNWQKPPSTPQVVLAQEEIWVYGLLCDSIARVNKVAAGAYNAPIPLVEQLAVGYPASEDDPGGARSSRILVPASGEPGAPPPEGAVGPRPPHPRFGGGVTAGPPAPPSEEGGATAMAASPDDALRNWIYVDFDGRPLSSAELASSADARMVHLMPFMLRVVIDERNLDALLLDLARSPVPIDVRQVRINTSGPSVPQPMDPMGAAGGAIVTTGRRHDISVELRGTVGLATPPDGKSLGIEIPLDVEEGGQQPPANAGVPTPPPADGARRRDRRRSETIG